MHEKCGRRQLQPTGQRRSAACFRIMAATFSTLAYPARRTKPGNTHLNIDLSRGLGDDHFDIAYPDIPPIKSYG